MESTTEISIKGMVCHRCKAVITDGVARLGFPVTRTELGKVFFSSPLRNDDMIIIDKFLTENGFELLADKKEKLARKVKAIIETKFSELEKYGSKTKFSTVLSETLNMNYDSISEIFAKSEGVTIEKYVIMKRLEKVKELLVYSDHSLTAVAYMTGFNSINHLSRQFKELMGLPPSHFKALQKEKMNLSHNGKSHHRAS
jgi:AraC-like DNA-binding protein